MYWSKTNQTVPEAGTVLRVIARTTQMRGESEIENGIFFMSERFQPTQIELDQRTIAERNETASATELAAFIIAELRVRGHVVRNDDVDPQSLYEENCHYITIENGVLYDLGFFCGNYKDGHLMLLHPQGKLAWRGFRPHSTNGTPQALHDTLLDILKESDGIDGVREDKDR